MENHDHCIKNHMSLWKSLANGSSFTSFFCRVLHDIPRGFITSDTYKMRYITWVNNFTIWKKLINGPIWIATSPQPQIPKAA